MANLVAEKKRTRISKKGLQDLNSLLIDRKFGRPEDFIEIFIYDMNNDIIASETNYRDYSIGQTTKGLAEEINIDPLPVLNRNGLYTGKYKLNINIQKRKIFNTTTPAFSIKTISQTRTEIQLSTTEGNTRLDSNSRNFIKAIQNSAYFRDFTLNFGDNVNLIAVNINIDKSNPREFLLNIKLLNPLPGNIETGTKLTIVEDITEPIVMTYNLGTAPIEDTSIPLKGPNFKIDTRLNAGVPSAFKSYNDILSTSTTSSYQKLISKLEGYEIPEIDYSYIRPVHSASIDFEQITPSHFENFVHFGSAVELLKNFEYKLKLIELYDKQLSELYSIPGNTSFTTITQEATSSILMKKENLIKGFSGYEQFLYYETGSNPYTWPKADHYGNTLELTTSETAKNWLGSEDNFHTYYGGQLLSASTFDMQNPNRLFKLTPSFIGDKEDNKPWETFCDMIGQHFDPIWSHTKEITQIRDNSHTLGVSKNLVYYALQNLGIDPLDQFENEDLIGYIFGEAITPNDTSTVITAYDSPRYDYISKEDQTKEIWKRIYHNAPYLFKTKGTERGLRALINCYGIPNTILDIKEFGSSNPDRDAFKLYTYEKFTQVLTGNTSISDNTKRGMFIETEWSSSLTDAMSSSAKTVEFRIKPTKSGSVDYHLFSLTNNAPNTPSGSDLHLILQPYTGSDDFFLTGDKRKYGRLNLLQYTSSIASSSYFQVYNGNFWDIHLSTHGKDPSAITIGSWTIGSSADIASNVSCQLGAYQANHLRDVLHYTQSFTLTQKANAESFGNPYYGGGENLQGVQRGYFGGIKNTITAGNPTSSIYTNNITSSFDLGYIGSLSEIRYYFGEFLSHETLKLHALEPLMYNGNSISSSYDHLILRYPLSFELELAVPTETVLPSASYEWNVDPTAFGSALTGPITGGAILSSSGYFQTGSAELTYSGQPFSPNLMETITIGTWTIGEYDASTGPSIGGGWTGAEPFVYPPSGSTFGDSVIFEVGGTPTLQSHHPNQNNQYLSGFTYFTDDDITLLTETHHLPTPNTIGKSPVNRKIYIDSGSTDDDILSPDILSQLPISDRQIPDFSNIGIFLSPQNEINEDIIYTLGTFSLDEFLGDPREETFEEYIGFKPLVNQYWKKLKKGEERYNIWDFVRWMQFLDHTLFDLLKKFTPQKSIDKTGLLIEPHFLERTKFKRYHPVTSRPEYKGLIQDVTASFDKNNNITSLSSVRRNNYGIGQLTIGSWTIGQGTIDYIEGSSVIAHYNFIGTGSTGRSLTTGINSIIDVAGSLSGSNTWEQGIIIPNSTGSGVKTRNSSGSLKSLRPDVLTPYGNFINQTLSKKVKKSIQRETDVSLRLINGLDEMNIQGSFISASGVGDDSIVVFTSSSNGTKANMSFNTSTLKSGRSYKVKYTLSGFSQSAAIQASVRADDGHFRSGPAITSSGNYEHILHIGKNQDDGTGYDSNMSYANRFWLSAVNGDIYVTASKLTLEELDPTRDAEFNDSLLEMKSWKRSRYEGSRLTGAKINKYTEGDITYGLNPVVGQKSVAFYFGKTIIGAQGTENDNLTTIKNHSYVDIEKIILVNKYTDTIRQIDLKNEDFKGINGYVANDFKDGASFNIELLSEGISHQLKDSYKAKFNQGYLYKIVEHKGKNGSGNVHGEGIFVGYIDSGSEVLGNIYATGSSNNFFCYGNSSTTTTSDEIVLKSNVFTKTIWPAEETFGHIDFITSSAPVNYPYSGHQELSCFINSMLIPVASESKTRLFGTFNLGQPLNVADYSLTPDAGIRSISTVEFDLEKYQISSSQTPSLHTRISASSAMGGFGKELLQPHSYIIPIMDGPHNVITTEKTNSGITWPINGGSTGGHASDSSGNIEMQYYFGGFSYVNSIYQISYLDETNTIIADIDKPIELSEGVGDKGYILIPDNLDKEIKDNLAYYLDKAGLQENPNVEKQPPRGN